MIQAQNVIKYYGESLALDDLSFRVNPGEVLGFLGPNGAGKTTTMRILTGYLPPTSGTATIAGYDVFHDSLQVRRHIGYLPETVPLYREMSVDGYLRFVTAIRRVPDADKAIDRVLESCDIGDVRDKLIGKLSKGYRQRVGLAQALVHDPDVVILDEPTIGLDPRQIRAIRQLIKDLAGDHTIILSTHILPEVSEICQRVLIINEGRIVAEDTPERLTAGLEGGSRVRMQVLNETTDARERITRIDGVTAVQALGDSTYDIVAQGDNDVRPELAALAVNAGWGLVELRAISMSLEDIFLKLTTDESAGQVGDSAELQTA